MSFDYEKVKDILVCPTSRSALVYDEETLVSVSPETRLCYPVVDGIPRLLEDEARTLSSEEWAEVMTRHNRDSVTGNPVEQK